MLKVWIAFLQHYNNFGWLAFLVPTTIHTNLRRNQIQIPQLTVNYCSNQLLWLLLLHTFRHNCEDLEGF